MSIQSEKRAVFSEINITPLTDIFLVLLIIMMVVAPTFQSVDNSIEIPEINSGVSIEQKDAIVTITADGTYYLNGKKISVNELYNELQNIKDSLAKKEVVVKADASVKSSLIMDVMRAAESANYEKLTIAGEPLSKKDAKALQEQQEHEQTTQNTETENMPKEKSTSDDINRRPIGTLPGD